MSILTQGNIQIESAIPIADIHNFHMEIQGNTHACVWLEGTVSDEEGEECLLCPMAGTRLTVRVDNRILFEGMLKEAQNIPEHFHDLSGSNETDWVFIKMPGRKRFFIR